MAAAVTLGLALPAQRWAHVALDVPLDVRFSYAVPPALHERAVRGVRVLVPYRTHLTAGLVLGTTDVAPEGIDPKKIRAVTDVLDARPVVSEQQLALVEWAASYYCAAIGEAVRLVLPAALDVRAAPRVARTDVPAPALAENATRLLAALEARGGSADPAELLACVHGARHLDLAELERLGVVAWEAADATDRMRARSVDRIRLSELAPAGEPRGSVQRSIVAFVREHGDATDAELRDIYQVSRATLRSLEAAGWITIEQEEVEADPFERMRIEPRSADPSLTPDQRDAVEQITAALDARAARTFLLYGITGSGKTEVYLRAARTAVAAGRGVLILLPEIALTPQFVGVFRAALGEAVAVQHSGLTPRERFDQWRRIRRGDVRVVIGARSALFAPLDQIGLIIVDEEHDGSFKQDTGVRYNARDLAVVLGSRCGAVTILGSATPSLESWANAERGRYRLLRLKTRPGAAELPSVELVDMRVYPPREGDPVSGLLSPPLQLAVRETVQAGEQAIIFINRRGFSPVLECLDCGEPVRCAQCDISMTFHRRGDRLRCHYCGATAARPTKCPSCTSANLLPIGAGTEQIEQVIGAAFGDARVARLDADVSRGRGLESVLDSFRRHETDILVGTQMLAKGHDFPKVTLVGVINADMSLRFPDFRSGERTFQLLAQVAGRAGRGRLKGRVLVQTWAPDHPVLVAAAAHDFETFAARELGFRQRLSYPPFGHVALLRVDSPDQAAAWRVIGEASRAAKLGRTEVLGPVESPIARVRNRYRMQAMLRSDGRADLRRSADAARAVAQRLAEENRRSDVRWSVDIDAQSML